MTTIYIKTRFAYPNKYSKQPEKLTISWLFNKVHWDKVNFVEVQDQLVSEYRYNAQSGKRLAVVTFDETKITEADLVYDLQNLGCHAKNLTTEEALALMRTTSCTESPEGTFECYPESVDPETGETVPAKYIVIG